MARTVATSGRGERRGRSILRLGVGLACLLILQGPPAVAGPSESNETKEPKSKPPARACRTVSAPGLLVLNDGCGLPVVLYAHAANEQADRPLRPDLLAAMAAEGYSVVMSDLCGPLNWGSSCAVDELRRLRERYSPDRPVRVLAVSMGGAALVNYATADPDAVLLAVGVVPVTTWETDWLRRATASGPSPLPDRVPFPYRIFSARDDEIVGPPVLRGRNVEVKELAGAHDLWQRIEVATVVEALDKAP